jgi:hypothetical protein
MIHSFSELASPERMLLQSQISTPYVHAKQLLQILRHIKFSLQALWLP